jgi:Spy/CpxP family protein refolding chaperone
MTEPTTTETPVAPVHPRGKRRRKMIILLTLTMLCGFACGVAATIIVLKSKEGHRPNFRRMPGRMLKTLDSRLNLTDEQKARLEPILAERHKAMMALFNETRPRMLAEMKQTEAAIKAILTPEQQEAYAKLCQRSRRRWDRSGYRKKDCSRRSRPTSDRCPPTGCPDEKLQDTDKTPPPETAPFSDTKTTDPAPEAPAPTGDAGE